MLFSNKRYDKIEFCTVTGGGPCLKYCEISLLERERTKEEKIHKLYLLRCHFVSRISCDSDFLG